MDLTHLDDVTPPTPDSAMRSRVVKTAQRRRRTRVALESATALAVIALVATSIVAARGTGSSVRVSTRPAPNPTNVQTFAVPSASMAPTLQARQRITADTSWQDQPLQRGDVIVFKAPPGESDSNIADLVKRVIGLPGDRLSARDNHVFLIPAGDSTGYELNEPYVKTTPDCPAGVQSPIAGRTLRPTTVPPGEYFVMGDNRCASEDSRAFGPIKRNDVIGRAFIHLNAPPPDITVRIELDHDTVARGGTIRGTLVFNNPNPQTITYPPGNACLDGYQVDVGTHTDDANQDWPLDCVAVRGSLDAAGARHALMTEHLAVPPGITRVRFSVPDAQIVGERPLPPRPSGKEFVYFVVEGGAPPGLVAPAPVPITIK
ncbi:MAG TPA: signal peptidase I [Acidimicrobiia bacterium]